MKNLTLICFLFSTTLFAQTQGTLMIVGGGNMKGSGILEKFKELAGEDAKLVIIPTAYSDKKLSSQNFKKNWTGLARYIELGFKNITVLHTRDPKVANSKSFVKSLKDADAVWITGGRQWRLADAYLGTKTQDEILNVVKRGGVVAGTSAGASIMASFMVRGDTRNNRIMIGDHIEGFGYLANTAIDQHVFKRNRQFDMVPVIADRPQLLGIGIDENTALLVNDNRAEVIGSSFVLIYRNKNLDNYLEAPFKVFGAGQVLNIAR
jgi:cyanophycinase